MVVHVMYRSLSYGYHKVVDWEVIFLPGVAYRSSIMYFYMPILKTGHIMVIGCVCLSVWPLTVCAITKKNAVWNHSIFGHTHWNGNVFILMKFSSLAALEVVKMTTSSAARHICWCYWKPASPLIIYAHNDPISYDPFTTFTLVSHLSNIDIL